jgi:hypothetical protein
MSWFSSPVIDDVILATSIINVLGFLLLLVTCRFVPGSKLTRPLMSRGWFKGLYRYHSYVWWVFVPSVTVHAVLGILHRLSGG